MSTPVLAGKEVRTGPGTVRGDRGDHHGHDPRLGGAGGARGHGRRSAGHVRPVMMLHVWVVPYPGGVFSDDLSSAATSAAVQAALAAPAR